jgi:hypothetical protein
MFVIGGVVVLLVFLEVCGIGEADSFSLVL